MVVVGEAGEARHAACVVVLEPLEKFTQFLSAFLLLLQPLTLLLGWISDKNKTFHRLHEKIKQIIQWKGWRYLPE